MGEALGQSAVRGRRALTVGQDAGQGRDAGGMSHDHHDIGVLVRLTNDRQDGFGGGVVERPQVMDFGLGTATRPQAFGRLASAGGRGAERLIDAKAMLMQPPTGLARLGYPLSVSSRS